MEKEKVIFKIDYELNWAYGVEISELKKDIEELEKLGAEYVQIESYSVYDFPYVKIDAYATRLETDIEFDNRKNELEQKKEKEKKDDLKLIEKLKQKYNLE